MSVSPSASASRDRGDLPVVGVGEIDALIRNRIAAALLDASQVAEGVVGIGVLVIGRGADGRLRTHEPISKRIVKQYRFVQSKR